jgi:L-alanine-DL-glutamate epimerase-like enolase superfamily enzyme
VIPEKITVYPIRLPRKKKLASGTFSYSEYQSVIVVIESEGYEGFGEAMSRYEPEILSRLVEYLFLQIRGKDVTPVDALEIIYSFLRVRGHTRGLEVEALSAIEIALWDLFGKIKRKKVSSLLGGEKTKRFSLVAGSVSALDKELEEEVEKVKRLSLSGLKLKIGFGLQRDVEAVKKIRNLWKEAILVVDANCSYSTDNALQFSRKIKEFNVSWFEEPIYPDDFNGYLYLRKRSAVKIGAGESWFLSDLENAVNNGIVDLLEPSVSRCGGITIMSKAGKKAVAKGIGFHPMVGANSSISLAASLHVASAVGVDSIEYDPFDNPLYRITTGFPTLKEGKMELPDGYGLGVKLNKEYLRKISGII